MILEIKKAGNKINSLARKIEESDKAGMSTRIPGYIEELEKTQESLKTLLINCKQFFLNK